MSFYVMMYLHSDIEEEAPLCVMYPFDMREEMDAFKKKVDSVFNDTYCDDCERYDDIERDESHE